ncbi:MAG: hypothetical protein GXP62_19465, partial [Oligoflexia bacterium]|nr:hypothetical protein [Oligoflexia bacterium]
MRELAPTVPFLGALGQNLDQNGGVGGSDVVIYNRECPGVQIEIAYVRCSELRGSGWIPVMLVDHVKLAAICTKRSGPLEWRLAYRRSETQKVSPGSWSN